MWNFILHFLAYHSFYSITELIQLCVVCVFQWRVPDQEDVRNLVFNFTLVEALYIHTLLTISLHILLLHLFSFFYGISMWYSLYGVFHIWMMSHCVLIPQKFERTSRGMELMMLITCRYTSTKLTSFTSTFDYDWILDLFYLFTVTWINSVVAISVYDSNNHVFWLNPAVVFHVSDLRSIYWSSHAWNWFVWETYMFLSLN